jgi:isoleucyl-tRNA synthetase
VFNSDKIQRSIFGTLYNTYSFFSLYANIDGFTYAEADIAIEERPEIDRWILSELSILISDCEKSIVIMSQHAQDVCCKTL